MPSRIITIFYSLVFVLSAFTDGAADISMPGFTGTSNTTVTTGFSARIDRNCESVRGYKRSDDTYAAFVNGTSGINHQHTVIAEADRSAFLADANPEGCATRKVDGYGNAVTLLET